MRSVRHVLVPLAVALTACTVAPATPDTSPTAPSISTSSEDASPDAGAGDGGTLRFALGENPGSIDPRFLVDEEGTIVADALFDSLVAIGDDLTTIEPAAAASWDVSDDGLTYTFHLREGATYHDGSPVVARDFVRSFRRIVDRDATPTSFLYYQFAPVEGYAAAIDDGEPLSGVRAMNRSTLRIRLSRPMSEFLQVLAHPSLAPIPASAGDDADGFATLPIGNGPFQMAEAWQPNQFIRVSRFADHAAPPRLDEVVFQIFADDPSNQQQYDDFERGQVDVAEVPPAQLEAALGAHGRSLDGETGPGVLHGLTGAIYAYGFNTQLAPFDDPAVRRAISMLIDRDRIVDQILLDARVPADTLVPPSLPGAGAGRCDHCVYDPAAARAELGLDGASSGAASDDASPTESGTEGGLQGPLEIVVNSGATNERIAERIASDIRDALGIEVTTRTEEPATFVGQLRAGEIGIFRLAWQADYASPGAVLQPLFRTDGIGGDNLTRFSDADVDTLLDQARTTMDARERNGLYAQAEERILSLAPVAPIFFYQQNRVVAAGVEDLRIGPLGAVSLERAWKRDGA